MNNKLLTEILKVNEGFPQKELKEELKKTLLLINENYENYDLRGFLIFKTSFLAQSLGFKSGLRHHEDPKWPTLYIVLPTGQVSWHMNAEHDVVPFDGHSQEECRERCRRYVEEE